MNFCWARSGLSLFGIMVRSILVTPYMHNQSHFGIGYGGECALPTPKQRLKLALDWPTRLRIGSWRCTVARLTTRTLLYPLNTSDKVGSFAVVRASGAALTSSSEVVVALYEASLFGIVWCTELPWVRAASTRGIQTILAHAPSSNQFTSG